MQRYEELRLILLKVAKMTFEVPEMSAYVKDHANDMVTHLNSWKKQKDKQMDNCDLMKGSTLKRGRKHVENVRNAKGAECNEGQIPKKLRHIESNMEKTEV
ncbi:hypothetical protein SLA2020_197040 [Shorea laevis]